MFIRGLAPMFISSSFSTNCNLSLMDRVPEMNCVCVWMCTACPACFEVLYFKLFKVAKLFVDQDCM